MARKSWRLFAPAVGIIIAALASLPALAAEQVLSYGSGVADSFEKLSTEAHYISFATPEGWLDTFPSEIQIYGRRYGDVSNVKGNIVLWGLAPKPAPGIKPDPDAPPLVIVGRQQFDLAAAPEQAGWFTVALEPVKLPNVFIATIYTFSTDARGLEIGLSAKNRERGHSAALKPEEAAAKGKGPQMRRDGREWLVRIKVRNQLSAASVLTSADLSGENFAANDDGTVEGFDTDQKYGMMVRFHTDSPRKVKAVYAYCKLAGNWFNVTRQAGVWLMNDRWGILNHQLMEYGQYTNVESWGSVDFPGIEVSGDYYILIEPMSRPEAELLIGYDSSSENKGSLYGTAGAVMTWGSDAPEEASNWMIRVEYE
jgi:hypothetical protein